MQYSPVTCKTCQWRSWFIDFCVVPFLAVISGCAHGSGVSRSSHRGSDISMHTVRHNLVRGRLFITAPIVIQCWIASMCCCCLGWKSLLFSSSKILPTNICLSLVGRATEITRTEFTVKCCIVLLLAEISLLQSCLKVLNTSEVLYKGITATAI